MKNNDIYITKLGGNYSLRVYVFLTNFTAILKIATKSAIFVYKTKYISFYRILNLSGFISYFDKILIKINMHAFLINTHM